VRPVPWRAREVHGKNPLTHREQEGSRTRAMDPAAVACGTDVPQCSDTNTRRKKPINCGEAA